MERSGSLPDQVVKRVPKGAQLSWIKNRVEADIRLVVEQYRLRTLSIGKVMQMTFNQTASSWHYDEEEQPVPRGRERERRRSPTRSPRRKDRKDRPRRAGGDRGDSKSSADKHRKSGVGETSKTMRNGELLCPDWNRGKCTEKESDCRKKMRHLCNVVIKKSGRVCAMHNHRGCEHKQPSSNRR